jgi:hypothetical protein
MEGWLMRNVLLVVGVLSLGIVPTYAADIGVEAKKLVIVDHLLTDARVKVTYLSRQKSDVTKGTGTDVNAIDAQVDVYKLCLAEARSPCTVNIDIRDEVNPKLIAAMAGFNVPSGTRAS